MLPIHRTASTPLAEVVTVAPVTWAKVDLSPTRFLQVSPSAAQVAHLMPNRETKVAVEARH